MTLIWVNGRDMPIIDFKCNACGHTDEFVVGATVENQVPEVCPVCGKGQMEKQFSVSGQNFDVIGGYDYEYGKKSFIKQSPEQRAKYLTKNENGSYLNPY